MNDAPGNGTTTLDDVLEAINTSSTAIEGRLGKIENRLEKVETRVTAIEAGMVTKDYLDKKLLKQKDDIIKKAEKLGMKVIE